MFVRRQVIPPHRDVDRNADVASVTGLDLLLQQVSRKVRMPPLAKRGGIERDPAVVAAGKAGYRVDPGPLERGGELLRVELRADTEICPLVWKSRWICRKRSSLLLNDIRLCLEFE